MWIIIGLLAGIIITRVLLLLSEIDPLDTREIENGIYSIKDSSVNMFLIRTGKKYIAIDAGNNAERIQEEMKKLNIDPHNVSTVFLTHTDRDHIAAVKLFTKATIYISGEEEQMINGQTKRLLFFKNRLEHDYETFEDDQVIQIENHTIKGIVTPGHTPGSTCFLLDGKYLFTGDTISLKSGKANLSFLSSNPGLHKKSLKKLAAVSGVKYIFTGHHGWSADFEKAFAGWKE